MRSRTGRRRPSRSRIGLSLTGALGLVASALVGGIGGTGGAFGAPGTPGVPQPNAVVFAEDFENGPGTSPQLLTDYVGDDGERYTADAPWLTGCNGIIANFSIPVAQLGNCVLPDSSAALRQLALALGVHSGAAEPSANDVVAAYTENSPGAGVEFATVDAIDLAGSTGRFLTFSVDAAALNCRVSAPQYQFGLVDEDGAVTQVGGTVNACASSSTVSVPAVGPAPARPVSVGTYASDGSFLFNGASLGVRFTNVNGSGAGNDAAFDKVRILDVTPQLDQSFEPATTLSGTTSDLTVTVTNTAELAAKSGWSFTETLPAGLTIADDTAATTCPDATLSAAEGGTSFRLAGDLDEDLASCTVTLPVTSPVAGTFTSEPSDFDSIGLNQPAAASVEFVDAAPALSIVKTASLAAGERFVAGQDITYSFEVTNTGNVPLTNVIVDDAGFSGSGTLSAVSCPPEAASLAPAASVTCTASYTATQADVDAGEIVNSATASGLPPEGQTVDSAPSEVTLTATAAAPSLTIAKTASPDTVARAGDSVEFSYVVTNTGNVTLTDVAVNEIGFTGSAPVPSVVCPPAASSLAPGDSTTCTAAYSITQDDADAGSVTNSATATGTPPDPSAPAPVSPPDDAIVAILAAPAVTLGVSADAAAQRGLAAGQTVTYSFTVTNTGTVTLRDVAVDAATFSGAGPLSGIVCPAAAASLAPGAQVICTATYTAQAADVAAGALSLSASATGTPPNAQTPAPVSDPASIAVPTAASVAVPAPAGSAARAESRASQQLADSGGETPVATIGLGAGALLIGALLTTRALQRDRRRVGGQRI